MLSVDTLAKVILNNCNHVSNKKLQKLSYYVYAWHLTIYDNEIAQMNFEAWEHGPVCRKLYNMYKKYGWNIIPEYSGFVLANDKDIKFIQNVLNVYGKFSADELEYMTHNEAPWQIARNGCSKHDASSEIISKESIISFYATQFNYKNQMTKSTPV